MAQPLPKGPLVARIGEWSLEPVRAGATGRATVEVENAGTVTWSDQIFVAYHWLDDRGNPIVWDGIRNPLPHPVEPGGRARVELEVQGPVPPGRYRFSLDLVAEHRAWFSELGGRPVEHDVEVVPRIERRLAVEGADPGALDAQDEPVVPRDQAAAVAYLAPGIVPAPDWSRRVLDAHQEGYGIVGGSIAVEAPPLRGRKARAALEAWRPGGGRVPGFPHPLVCPSIALDAVVDWTGPIAGLPAARPGGTEPALYDARITARLRSDRRRA